MKTFFRPNIESCIDKPLRMISFQRAHQNHIFKLVKQMVSSSTTAKLVFTLLFPQKSQSKKAFQFKAQLEQEVRHLRQKYEAGNQRRKQMQEKLLQIHQRNQQKEKEKLHQYRQNLTTSSDSHLYRTVSGSVSSASANQSAYANLNSTRQTGFFEMNAPMFSQVAPGGLINPNANQTLL
jgi:phage regulator Rha-like protein